MDLERLYSNILHIYQTYGVTSFPVDCFDIIRGCGYKIVKYSDLTDRKRAACRKLSRDACLVKNILCYEHSSNEGRIRFSIMHELGHVVMETDSEDEADLFASNILVPRAALHHLNCKTSREVHHLFHVSYSAGQRALEDYRSGIFWGYRDVQKATRDWFYPPAAKTLPSGTGKSVQNPGSCIPCSPEVIFSSALYAAETHNFYETEKDCRQSHLHSQPANYVTGTKLRNYY